MATGNESAAGRSVLPASYRMQLAPISRDKALDLSRQRIENQAELAVSAVPPKSSSSFSRRAMVSGRAFGSSRQRDVI